jgi:uncharacterized protein YecE (DUF72 family)
VATAHGHYGRLCLRSEVLYTSGYTVDQLDLWAERAVLWARGGEVTGGDHASPEPAPKLSTRDVYVYFDNDAKVWAPKDAEAMARKVAAFEQRPTMR